MMKLRRRRLNPSLTRFERSYKTNETSYKTNRTDINQSRACSTYSGPKRPCPVLGCVHEGREKDQANWLVHQVLRPNSNHGS